MLDRRCCICAPTLFQASKHFMELMQKCISTTERPALRGKRDTAGKSRAKSGIEAFQAESTGITGRWSRFSNSRYGLL